MLVKVTMPKERNRIENLAELMKSIREIEDTEIFSGALWRSPESRHEETVVFWIEGVYPGLLLDTGRRFIFVRREMTGMSYSDQFSIEDWSESDWVKYTFDPFDDIYGVSRNCPNMFKGDFIDACKYVLNFWMSRG